MTPLESLNEEVLTAERRAIAKAMLGLWTHDDDAHLAALYESRRRLIGGES